MDKIFQSQQAIDAFKATVTITLGGNLCIFIFTLFDINKNLLRDLLAFSIGALLGDVFLHLIPHAIEAQSAENVGISKILKLNSNSTNSTHGHSHSTLKNTDGVHWIELLKKPGVTLNMIADFAHNFTDGLALAASYQANEQLGFAMTVAITVHEIPHEIGDFAVLLSEGLSKKHAFLFQFISAIGAFAGCLFGLVFGETFGNESILLGFTAGGFIYVSLVNILPNLFEQSGKVFDLIKQSVLFGLGVVFMMFISVIEPHDHGHSHEAHGHH
eukprot:snap_masked-scaffold_4-processed-gene-1.24-mRNA-1 protein AED:0.22 eAED:0.22 QI:0/0/0/0.5/1/1/2/0/271